MQYKTTDTAQPAPNAPTSFKKISTFAETIGLLDDTTHMRMDPRIQSRIHDVVSIVQRDYTSVLMRQIGKLRQETKAWSEGDCAAEGQTYALAHEIRDIAGAFARPLAGEIAARICSLIETVDVDDCEPTIRVVDEFITALAHIVELTPEPIGMSATVLINRLDEIASEAETARAIRQRA